MFCESISDDFIIDLKVVNIIKQEVSRIISNDIPFEIINKDGNGNSVFF